MTLAGAGAQPVPATEWQSRSSRSPGRASLVTWSQMT
jgi:hypothetical protein